MIRGMAQFLDRLRLPEIIHDIIGVIVLGSDGQFIGIETVVAYVFAIYTHAVMVNS